MALFSERYGYTKPSDMIIREQITPEIQNDTQCRVLTSVVTTYHYKSRYWHFLYRAIVQKSYKWKWKNMEYWLVTRRYKTSICRQFNHRSSHIARIARNSRTSRGENHFALILKRCYIIEFVQMQKTLYLCRHKG